MLAVSEDDLVCDLAETYQVHDMYAFPVLHIATLAKGLRDDSRIKMRLTEQKTDLTTILLAMIADNTALRLWQNTKDGHKGINRPKSVMEMLAGADKKQELRGFSSGEEFMKEWEKLNG